MVVASEGHDSPSDTGAPPPALVERERELALFGELVRRSAAGRSGLVVLEGPVGIGKTALLRALVAEARGLGLSVVHTEAAGGHRLPLSTAHALLSGLPGGVGPSVAHGLADRRPPTLLCCDNDAKDVSFGVLTQLHDVIRRAAARTPLLIAVDDAQEADPASLRLLAHTARRLAGLPVLLALVGRSGSDAPALAEITTLASCRVLRPRPLTGPGIGLLARRLTGAETDAAFQQACLAATHGNPLLATRLIRTLRAEDLPLTGAELSVVGEQDMQAFGARVVRLLHRQAPATVDAARAMAVLGDGSPHELCARLALVDAASFDRSLLVLGSLGLVNGDRVRGTWAFTHALVRRAVLEDLPDDERAAAHGRAARLLHDFGAGPADVADHLCRSAATATQPWATTVLREAAREAMLHASPSRAVTLLRPCVPDGAADDCDPGLLIELGTAEARVDPEAGVRHLTAALDRTTSADLRFEALSALADALTRQGRMDRAFELLDRYRSDPALLPSGARSTQLLEAQLLMAATVDRDAYTRLLDTVSFDLSLPDDTIQERALLAARAVISVSRMDRVAESVAVARRITGRGGPTANSPAFLTAAASVLLYADLPYEAQDVYHQLIDGADVLLDQAYPVLLALSAEAHERLGDLDGALRYTAEALRDTTVARAHAHEALPLAVRLHTLLDRGRLAEADDLCGRAPDPARSEAWQWNELLCARGRLRLAQEDAERALADLEECGRRQAAWQRTNPAVSSWWYWAGQAHLALGDRRAARTLAEQAVDGARSANLPLALGAGLELWAATAAADERAVLLEEAEDALDGTRAALLTARVKVARGRALHDLGYRKAAREVLRQGWEEAYTLGARPLHEVARRALLATGARPRRPVSRGPAALTRSEAQVARLAADGRSNAWIAETLFVTQRTVEVHLTSVYRKLGLSGRRELRDALESADVRDGGRRG
ncbi:LuxR family transcriptional regulator [Streptomyces sp. Tu 3180]|uniref:AAA family ATPase n=1 Tax=Streptomyces sp. Tu 3180 TaxID=2682611 RepID=UPI00135A2B99|nr:LuxR family transcriptional regulator [Streptomyces sp. Tu 3180]KAF3463534.1 AAA family ATPase [Streptomyces sp. Tu 3180]